MNHKITVFAQLTTYNDEDTKKRKLCNWTQGVYKGRGRYFQTPQNLSHEVLLRWHVVMNVKKFIVY